jgi:prevent-host-death family protein
MDNSIGDRIEGVSYVGATDFRNNLTEMVEKARTGPVALVTGQKKRPVTVLISYEEFKSMRSIVQAVTASSAGGNAGTALKRTRA